MRIAVEISTLVLAGAGLFCPHVLIAQNSEKPAGAKMPVPRTADGHPDFSGTWSSPTEPGEEASLPKQYGPMKMGVAQEAWAMTPWAQAQFDYNWNPTKGTNAHGARLELNPRYAHCVPYSPIQLVAGFISPFEILQTPKKLFVFYENDNMVRQIFTDGRKHPESLELTWEGHSIGQWEGDTLVADTIGMRDETWIDDDGHVHSDQLHMVERVRRIDYNTLQIDLTLNDPKALEKPWTEHIFRKLRPDWDIREDMRCTEHIKKGIYGDIEDAQ
jgi:hypothetical protein